jgi:hypothetical protein
VPARGHSTRVVLPDSIESLSIASHARCECRSLIDSSHRVKSPCQTLGTRILHSCSLESSSHRGKPRQLSVAWRTWQGGLGRDACRKSPAEPRLKLFEPKLSSVSRPQAMRAGTTTTKSLHCLASVNGFRVAVCGSLARTSARESPLEPFWHRAFNAPLREATLRRHRVEGRACGLGIVGKERAREVATNVRDDRIR